jgi:hypothetical protein
MSKERIWEWVPMVSPLYSPELSLENKSWKWMGTKKGTRGGEDDAWL